MPAAVRSQLALPGASAKVRVQRLARRCPLEPYELKIAELWEQWQKISEKFERMSGPPSPSQQLSKLIEEGAVLGEAPDALVHATPAPATKTRRGRRPIHDWWDGRPFLGARPRPASYHRKQLHRTTSANVSAILGLA